MGHLCIGYSYDTKFKVIMDILNTIQGVVIVIEKMILKKPKV